MFEEIREEVKIISPLISDIVHDSQTLVRKEFELARREIREDVQKLAIAATTMAGAGVLALCAISLLAWTLVHGLHAAFSDLPLWGCFGIVTLLFGGGAYLALRYGQKRLEAVDFVPHKTLETMRENGEWLKTKI